MLQNRRTLDDRGHKFIKSFWGHPYHNMKLKWLLLPSVSYRFVFFQQELWRNKRTGSYLTLKICMLKKCIMYSFSLHNILHDGLQTNTNSFQILLYLCAYMYRCTKVSLEWRYTRFPTNQLQEQHQKKETIAHNYAVQAMYFHCLRENLLGNTC